MKPSASQIDTMCVRRETGSRIVSVLYSVKEENAPSPLGDRETWFLLLDQSCGKYWMFLEIRYSSEKS